MSSTKFERGASIVVRSVSRTHGTVGTVWPRTVVSDDDELVVLFTPAGSVGKSRTGERGGPRGRILVRPDGGHEDAVWKGNVLLAYRPGDAFSVWVAWTAPTWEVRWRYVNIEEPWRRTPIGFDTRDLELDLWSGPNDAEWHWKDEDEIEWLVASGELDPVRAREIRAIGEDALARNARCEPPFDRDWRAWRPDDGWSIPTVPSDWARPP
jgi:hypothetical protein